MNIVGLITEYNPFHNGHLHHLQEAKHATGAEAVVVVMSGHFLQRGEAALFNKWARACMAVEAGADLVFEIPAAFTIAGAPSFALGSVSLLHATRIVTHLCFGSECGDIDLLQKVARLLAQEPPELSMLIKEELGKGLSYPCALPAALGRLPGLPASYGAVMSTPNNMLGIEYLKALIKLNCPIDPVTIRRTQAGYHDPDLPEGTSAIASATAIRNHLAQYTPTASGEGASWLKALKEMSFYVPPSTLSIVEKEVEAGRGPVFNDNIVPFIKYNLLSTAKEVLSGIFDVSEGLENRLKEITRVPGGWERLLDTLKTRRFSRTRLQRVLMQCLLGYTKDMAAAFHQDGPGYLRLLAFSRFGRNLLPRIKNEATLPLVTNVAPFIKDAGGESLEVTPSALTMLQLDLNATDVYSLLYPSPEARVASLDYLLPPAKPLAQNQ